MHFRTLGGLSIPRIMSRVHVSSCCVSRAHSGRVFCSGVALLGALVCLASDWMFITVTPLVPSTVFTAVWDRY